MQSHIEFKTINLVSSIFWQYFMISFRLPRRAKEAVRVKLSMTVGRSENTSGFFVVYFLGGE